jgi:hypothetical protein
MAIIQCKGCGAPLDVAEGVAVVVCQYCKAQSHVAKSQPSVHVHVHMPPPVMHPPPPVMHVPPPPVMHVPPLPVARASSSAAGLVVGLSILLTLVGVGVAVAVAVQQSGGGLPGVFGGPSYGSWSGLGTCPVDANGDGVDDVAGLAGPPGQSYTPTIVDGTNGQVIWQGADAGEGARLECIDRQWIVVGEADFDLRLHDARSPDVPLSLRGRDELRAAAMGKGCAAIKTTDGSVMGVALPAGTPTECEAAFRSPFDRPGMIGLTGEKTELTVAGRRYTLTKRRSGTPVLTLRVEEQGKTLLEQELPYTAATFSSGLAVAGEHVVVFGARPGKQDQGVLVGLDAKTGAERYAVPLTGQVTNNIGAMFHNGRHVVLQYWTHLRAYDPATGEQVW